MGSLVFVTTELSPFTSGGVGRVVHNILKCMSSEDRRRTHVLALDCNITAAEFEATFPGARLATVASDAGDDRYEMGGHHPPRRAFSDTVLHWNSSVVLRALRGLAGTVEIDYLEFPDWGGLGFATIQEKRISGFLDHATIAVRLHSTCAVILHHEAHVITDRDRATVDLERKALRDCDVVIAQLTPVAEQTRQIFGFARNEWERRIIVHAPPVWLDSCPPKAATVASTATMPIMFGSKIQRFKRPDLFVRGVGAYCHANPGYSGDVLISAHNVDDDYRDSIVKLIAPDLGPRVHFEPPRPNAVREPLIATTTFVVPSDFESFCLAAFEASLLGARLIINEANPAFGNDTPWRDGVNCYKFDGTPLGLQKALERNFADGASLRPVTVPTGPSPWQVLKRPDRPSTPARRPLVSVIIPHFNLGEHLPAALESVLEQSYENIEIIVVDDRSTDDYSRDLIEGLRKRNRSCFKVMVLPGNVGLAAARNILVEHASGEFVLPLDADDLLHRRFIETAVRALEKNPEFDVFVTPAAYFHENEPVPLPGEAADFPDYAVFVGEALVAGLRENRFSTATAVVRADVLRKYRYIDSLRCFEDWNLYLRLAIDGVRFLVSNDVYFYYRNRAGSMVKASNDPARAMLFMHDMLRTGVDVQRLTPLAYLALLSEPSPRRGTEYEPVRVEHSITVEPAGSGGVRKCLRAMRRVAYRLNPTRMVLAWSDLFDRDWYLRTNADVGGMRMDPIEHYIRHGAREGRDPGPLFSTRGYLAANPDVDAAGVNPLLHYLRSGRREGRRTCA